MRNGDNAQQLRMGFEAMARQSVVICGLARNCARRLGPLIAKLDQLSSHFGNSNFLVVENDSTDQTGAMLRQWAAGDGRVELIQMSLLRSPTTSQVSKASGDVASFSHDRIKRMAYLRNLYLDRLSAFRQHDLVIVVDFDIHDFSIEGVAHSLGAPFNWDCVAANCLRFTPRHPARRHVYWDTYAYEPDQGFPGNRLDRPFMLKSQLTLREQLKTRQFVPVRSAFGGLALYKAHALSKGRYSVVENRDPLVRVLSEHIGLHRALAAEEAFSMYISNRQTVLYESAFSVIKRLLGRINGQ